MYMAPISDAVILAGGAGTRMLPASLYGFKESLPLVDTPILNHLVWEAARSGVSRIHLVLSDRKMHLLNEFLEVDFVFEGDVRTDLPRDSLRLGTDGIEIIPHVQKKPGGVADAIATAIKGIEGPFLVLLGDMVLLDEQLGPKYSGPNYASTASLSLVKSYEDTGLPCVGVYGVGDSEIAKYGIVKIEEGLVRDIVEKPKNTESPGNQILCGRYIFPADTDELLARFPKSVHGELQSIAILHEIICRPGLRAVNLDHMRMYDSGEPLSWLKSQIDHALRRSDIGPSLADWLEKRMRQ